MCIPTIKCSIGKSLQQRCFLCCEDEKTKPPKFEIEAPADFLTAKGLDTCFYLMIIDDFSLASL